MMGRLREALQEPILDLQVLCQFQTRGQPAKESMARQATLMTMEPAAALLEKRELYAKQNTKYNQETSTDPAKI